MTATKCCSIRRHSHEFAYKHQILCERKIKSENRVVAWQHEASFGGTDMVDVDDAEI